MISDIAARKEALDPRRSFIVQAPAGSGKTGLLVYRMLTLLATVDASQQVLAITFTRKATAEMRERLVELLTLAEEKTLSDDAFEQQGIDLAKAVLQQDKKYNWRLLDTPHQLQILTIDAFCAKLTTSMPWLGRFFASLFFDWALHTKRPRNMFEQFPRRKANYFLAILRIWPGQ